MAQEINMTGWNGTRREEEEDGEDLKEVEGWGEDEWLVLKG